MGIRTRFNPMGGMKIASGVAKVVCSTGTTWFITKKGDLYGCGAGSSGQQGSGNTSNVTTFTKRASNVKDVIIPPSGGRTFYIDNNDDLYGCGWNGYGQLGIGTSGSGTELKVFTKLASNVKKLLSTTDTTWYIDNNDDLYGCGRNNYYQQGPDDMIKTTVTTFTKRGSNVKDVFSGYYGYNTWYLTNDNVLYSCGWNAYGQLGEGNTSDKCGFTSSYYAANVKDFACSDMTSFYINTSGALFGCGRNNNGQSGVGYASTTSPYAIKTFTRIYSNVSQVVSDGYFTFCTQAGRLLGCGLNLQGQLGVGDTSTRNSFVLVSNDASLIKIKITTDNNQNSTSWYINSSGDLYGCGYNANGQQGSGGTSNILTFTKRGSNVKDFACSTTSTWYIDNNDVLYGCGLNSQGQQGNGSTSNVLTFENKMQYI